jgi:hypothetical protein
MGAEQIRTNYVFKARKLNIIGKNHLAVQYNKI